MPMGEQIASLFVTVSADTSRFNSGLRGVQNNVRNAGRDLMNLATTAAAALGGAAIISTVSNFESKMAELQARTGLGADEMARMRDVALNMGSTTVFSATTAADALLELVAGGMEAKDAISTLQTVLDLAASSGLDLGTAADSITDILAMFDLDPSQAQDVADALTQIAGLSSADVSDVILAFNNVGPVAKGFGIGVRELAAAIGLLSDQGIKGAEAGTALKSMLLQMSQNVPETQRAWEKLGTSLYDVEGNVRNLDDVLADIRVGLESMPVEEQNQVIQALAGSYGQVALRALLASAGISATVIRMDAAATSAEVAAARTATFQGKVDQLKNSVEVLAIETLTPFIDNTLSPLVDYLIVIAGEVGNWTAANPELTSTIVTLVGAVVGLGIVGQGLHFVLAGLSSIVAVGGALISGLIAVGGAIWALTGPIGVVTLAVGGLIFALSQLKLSTAGFVTDTVTAIDAANNLKDTLATLDQNAFLFDQADAARATTGTGTSGLGGSVGSPDSPDAMLRRALAGEQAFGGPVMGKRTYLVGERGPELFVPPTGGRILPNDRLGGVGAPVVVPVTLTLDGKVVAEAVVRQDRITNGRMWGR